MQVSASPGELAAEVFKAVSDPTRVRILALIQRAGELCGCHVETALALTQSRASRHLTALRRAGLLQARREGAFVHYRAFEPADAPPLQAGILRTIAEQFAEDPEVRDDTERATRCRESGDCGSGGPGR